LVTTSAFAQSKEDKEDWESGNTYKEDGEFTFEFHNYTVGKGLDVELQ
jgi:hypothetical protein